MKVDVSEPSLFVFITCQAGAEAVVKQEIAHKLPSLRFAFSRSGFLTFKLAPHAKLPDDWSDRLVFARTAGVCLGKVAGDTPEDRAREVWKLLEPVPVSDLHVWPRDKYSPGFRDYEPGMTPEAAEVERVVRAGRAAGSETGSAETVARNMSATGQASLGAVSPRAAKGNRPLVADVILVGPEEWWVGYHQVRSVAMGWVGGFLQATLPENAVSRAWLKMNEAVLWSEFPMQPGEKCIEIGSAPGGASQYLLSRGLQVTGVDPALMDPIVLTDKNFRHIRKRAKEVPRQEFVGVDWLTCDVNLPPNYTLDTVKAIVTFPGVHFKGLLLTFKLVEWSLAEELPKYLARLRSWGFRQVSCRQLHHNRQEVCVAASDFQVPRLKPKAKEKPKELPKPPIFTGHRKPLKPSKKSPPAGRRRGKS
jgi:23S rRNA (cytidine2498-2'-O)-methyltransferase